MWNPLRRIVYYHLATEGHSERWPDTNTDVLLEYSPVRTRL
jgi:hypothetical protein